MAQVQKCEFSIEGMHCDSCEVMIEQTLKKQSGVVSAKANSASQKVDVTVSAETDVNELREKLAEQIIKHGYKVVDTFSVKERSQRKMIFSGLLAGIIFILFLILQKFNLTSFFNPSTLSFSAIFLLGVLASLSTCMAVVGGVAMTLSTKFAAEQRSKATLVFHLSRIGGFFLLGGIIGLLGRAIIINAFVSALLRLLVAVVMVSVGAEIVGIRLPKLVLPKAVTEIFGIFNDREGWGNAVFLGVVTFFLPCAFTQSMQLYAMSSGSFFTGALVMGVFALGTFPILGLISLGSATSAASKQQGIFSYTMGYLIILFALLNILNVLVAFGVLPHFVL